MEVRKWIAPLFFLAGLVLLPWTLWLLLTLPAQHRSEHWSAVWTGFDAALAIALIATAVSAFRRSTWLEAAAASSGTLLLCDAWFDILLESGSRIWIAILEAVIVELPLAALCFWIARDAERVLVRSLDDLRERARG
ncbi:MAG: hypothetical protein ACR2MU_05750 [Gaiellaceae bacterium]